MQETKNDSTMVYAIASRPNHCEYAPKLLRLVGLTELIQRGNFFLFRLECRHCSLTFPIQLLDGFSEFHDCLAQIAICHVDLLDLFLGRGKFLNMSLGKG